MCFHPTQDPDALAKSVVVDNSAEDSRARDGDEQSGTGTIFSSKPKKNRYIENLNF